MTPETIKTLKKAANRPKIAEGTVVTFKVTFGEDPMRDLPGQTYSYAAFFVNNFWYLTSQRETSALDDGAVIRPRLNQNGFTAVLASSQVHDIKVATEWETIL